VLDAACAHFKGRCSLRLLVLDVKQGLIDYVSTAPCTVVSPRACLCAC
jgi:hypothetical protein